MTKKTILESLKIVIIAIALIFSVGLVQAWTGPTATPPNNNVAAPINVSNVTQEKGGIFGSRGFYSLGSGWFSTSTRASWPPANLTLGVNGAVGAKLYCDDNGQNCVTTLGGGGNDEYDWLKAHKTAMGIPNFPNAVDCWESVCHIKRTSKTGNITYTATDDMSVTYNRSGRLIQAYLGNDWAHSASVVQLANDGRLYQEATGMVYW